MSQRAEVWVWSVIAACCLVILIGRAVEGRAGEVAFALCVTVASAAMAARLRRRTKDSH